MVFAPQGGFAAGQSQLKRVSLVQGHPPEEIAILVNKTKEFLSRD
jgi:hypothetical protein